MSKKKSNKKNKAAQPPKHDTTEIRGVLLLAASLIMLLSLLSFALDNPSHNWLGLMGQNIGWFFHAFLGLGSYLICVAIGLIGWQLIFTKRVNHFWSKAMWFAVMTGSFCLLLSLIETQFPPVGDYLRSHLYTGLWERKLRYHLGGALFSYIYNDIPTFNLHRIFNTIGVAIIFTSTFLASLLFLTKISPAEIIQKLQALYARWLNRPAEQSLAPAMEHADIDSQRYVKVRIPGSAQAQQTENSSQTSTQQELLAIQPETNLKVRPSLSRKEYGEATFEDKPEKGKKKEIAADTPNPAAAALAVETKAAKTAPSKDQKRKDALAAQRVHNGDFTGYKLPTLNLLSNPKKVDQSSLKKDLRRQAEVLEETLSSFGIEAKVGQINCGPTITSFEVHPAIGVKVQKIKTLENDIALNMEAKSIRIIAPIPGKAAVGIEVPNPQPQEVSFKEMLQAYQQGSRKFHIPVLLGKAVNGDYVMNDLTKMPHCIIAGATGSGKSVCINTIVMSILLNARPDEIKLIMVDPKKVELTPYTKLPHMLAPVITEPQGACAAMHWLVKEMENRYEILKVTGARNIEAFNNRTVNQELESALDLEIPAKMHYIVGIIDELADLMMVSSNDIETPIARIAQMARAVGIHLILATQRPSREVITGLIKANFPTRIAFKVASRVNSQIILDEVGAETLLGNGDMLFLPPGTSHLMRAQGAFIRDEDINAVVKHICDQAPPNYVIESFDALKQDADGDDLLSSETPSDSLYEQALEIVKVSGNASTTFLQRKLKIGYARAASLIDELEARGVVGAAEGSKPRKILVSVKAPEPEELESDDIVPEKEEHS